MTPDAILAAVRQVTGIEPIGGGQSSSRIYVRRVAVYSLHVIAGLDMKAVAKALGITVDRARYTLKQAEGDAGVLAAVGRVRRIIDATT